MLFHGLKISILRALEVRFANMKAIFLDRDGVINHDPGDYTKNLSEFTILPTVLDSLKVLKSRGFVFVLITNQGGIAKGLYGHEEVAEIHEYFLGKCEENGTPILDVYYSPHHDSTGKSLSRKPGSMMIERAVAKHGIDPKASWMIGDKQRDLECASPLGVKGLLIPTNAPLADYLDTLK